MSPRTSVTRNGGLPAGIAFYTDARAWGGAEVYLEELLPRLAAAGFAPKLFCSRRDATVAWVERLGALGVDCSLYDPVSFYHPRAVPRAARLLRGFEIVHVSKPHPRICLPAVWGARTAGAKVVVTTEHLANEPVSHFPMGGPILHRVIRRTNRLVDATIAVSELSRRELLRVYGMPERSIVTIRNGVDLTRFLPRDERPAGETETVRRSLGLAADSAVGVLVGAMIERKGQHVAIRAIPRIRERVPGFTLVLIGEGPGEAALRDEVESLGVSDAVVFGGFRSDIPEILAAADLLLLPSSNECLPLVVLEAMAAGLPVVASDVGGISEAVEDGVTGSLIGPEDPEGLAEAVGGVLEAPGRAKRMGEAALAKARGTFGVEACVAAVVGLYERLYRERIQGGVR